MATNGFSSLCLVGGLLVFCLSAQNAPGVGAVAPFTTLEAEAGILGGGAAILSMTSLPSAPTVQLESSGRKCVKLDATSESVAWTKPVLGLTHWWCRKLSPVTRYVRITVTRCTQVNGSASFYECNVHGTRAPAMALTPTNITTVIADHILMLSWPENYLGWRLQVQTNLLPTGLNTNWVTQPGSELVTSANIMVNPTNGAVFFLLGPSVTQAGVSARIAGGKLPSPMATNGAIYLMAAATSPLSGNRQNRWFNGWCDREP